MSGSAFLRLHGASERSGEETQVNHDIIAAVPASGKVASTRAVMATCRHGQKLGDTGDLSHTAWWCTDGRTNKGKVVEVTVSFLAHPHGWSVVPAVSTGRWKRYGKELAVHLRHTIDGRDEGGVEM